MFCPMTVDPKWQPAVTLCGVLEWKGFKNKHFMIFKNQKVFLKASTAQEVKTDINSKFNLTCHHKIHTNNNAWYISHKNTHKKSDLKEMMIFDSFAKHIIALFHNFNTGMHNMQITIYYMSFLYAEVKCKPPIFKKIFTSFNIS